MNNPAPPPVAQRKAGPPPIGGAAPAVSSAGFSIVSGPVEGAQRVVIYGPGGIGKSTLASLAPKPVFLDLEESTRDLNVERILGLSNYEELRACLRSSALDPFETVVIDSVTRAEEWAVAHTLATVRRESGDLVDSIEGYGFGKGYQHVYDTFLHLLVQCDTQIRNGRNVVLIAHDCVTDVPNPTGENYIRFEPHLQSPKSGKASIRNRVVQWADHVLFVGYDVAVDKAGKGRGGGTRRIYPSERPDHVAKSRRISAPLNYDSNTDGAIWPLILGGAK